MKSKETIHVNFSLSNEEVASVYEAHTILQAVCNKMQHNSVCKSDERTYNYAHLVSTTDILYDIYEMGEITITTPSES